MAMAKSVAEQLGIDPERMEWQDWAACKGTPIEGEAHPFFDGYEKGDASFCRAIDSLCNSCPVQRICGEYAQDQREEGMWGGVYWTATGRVDAKKNSHKTDEDWKNLAKVYGRRMKPQER